MFFGGKELYGNSGVNTPILVMQDAVATQRVFWDEVIMQVIFSMRKIETNLICPCNPILHMSLYIYQYLSLLSF